MGSIADLFFTGRLDDGKLQIDAKKSGDKAGATLGQSLTSSLKKSFSGAELGKGFVQGLGLAGALGGAQLLEKGLGAVTDLIGDSITAASDLNESMSKSGVIFGKASKEIEDFASTADKSLGLSKQAALEAAAQFGNLFRGTGKSQEEAAGLSKAMVTLAGDLASFNNLDPTETLEKLRSGLTGEAEPLRSMGVFLTEAKVKTKAMQLGLAGAHGELSEGAKVMARYQIILDETQSAQGDFARTADGIANSQRILNAEMENAKAELGQELLPLEKKWIELQRDAIPVLGQMAEGALKVGDGLQYIAESIDDAFGAGDNVDKLNFKMDAATVHTQRLAKTAADMASAVVQSLDKTADGGTAMSDDMVKAFERVRIAALKLRTGLLLDSTKIVNDYYDVLIAKDDLAATNAEINALRTIATKRKLTSDEISELHRLEQTQAQTLADLASKGASQSAVFTNAIDGLLKRLKNAHGAERRAILAEITQLKLLAIAAKIANGQVLTLNESIGATLAKGGYINASGASTGNNNSMPAGTGYATNNVSGGPLPAWTPSWVGEGGPELIVPGMDSTIIPHTQSMALAAAATSSGGDTFHLSVQAVETVQRPIDIVRELRIKAQQGYLGRRRPVRSRG